MSEVNWAEKRNALRQRTLKQGRIVVAGLSTMDCLIRNMSLTGARVAVPNAHTLPDEFELLIGDEGLRRECEVMSRSDSSAGLRFMRPLTPRELGAEFMSTKRGPEKPQPQEQSEGAEAPRVSVSAPALDADQTATLLKIKPAALPKPIARNLPWAAKRRGRALHITRNV